MSPSYTDWPKRGDKRAQPWQQDPDEESTPSLRAGLPLLTAGVQHPAVHELFSALATLGYPTPVSRGENPFGIVGAEEMAAVRSFRRDYGVKEDPGPFGGDHADAIQAAEQHIGPWTCEAILRAAAREGDTPQLDAGGDLTLRVAQLEARLERLEQRHTSSSRSSSSKAKAKSGS